MGGGLWPCRAGGFRYRHAPGFDDKVRECAITTGLAFGTVSIQIFTAHSPHNRRSAKALDSHAKPAALLMPDQ